MKPVRFVHDGSMRYDRAGGERPFDAFGQAVRADPTLVLHLVGSVSPSNASRAQAAIPAANPSLDGFVSHDEALRRMADADVLVVISSVSEAGAGTLTGKIFERLAVRRPILLISPPGPATELVTEAEIGVEVGLDDPTLIAGAMAAAAALARSGESGGASEEVLGRFDRTEHARTWSGLRGATIGSRPPLTMSP